MIKVTVTLVLFLLVMGIGHAQDAKDTQYNAEEISITNLIDGTLLVPSSAEKPTLAIIIQGSGPTDRDGNQRMMKNNSLKYLAEALYTEGVASFRFDKRIVRMLRKGTFNEKGIRFDDFVDDAIAVVDYFKKEDAYSKIYVIGHSQGSLIGMVAAQGKADGFISLAGAGQEIDDVIVDQLALQAPGLKDDARSAFDDMRVNGVAQKYSPGLASIFRPEIQPFMLTWMQFDPQVELAKLTIPVLIVNGGKDLQVQVSEAELLKSVKPDASYTIIESMNHILKDIEGGDMENSKSYNQPGRPISPALMEAVIAFIKS